MIRRFIPDDAVEVARFRKIAVADSPLAFGAGPNDDPAQDTDAVAENLRQTLENVIVGDFDPGLVGMVGLISGRGEKRRHKGTIWGFFVLPNHRKQGIGTRLMNEAISISNTWEGVAVIHLSVNEHGNDARRVYEELGFKTWGVEADALRIGRERYTEYHMNLTL